MTGFWLKTVCDNYLTADEVANSIRVTVTIGETNFIDDGPEPTPPRLGQNHSDSHLTAWIALAPASSRASEYRNLIRPRYSMSTINFVATRYSRTERRERQPPTKQAFGEWIWTGRRALHEPSSG